MPQEFAKEGHHFAVSFLTWLMGIAGLSVVILMGLDGIQMKGVLVRRVVELLSFQISTCYDLIVYGLIYGWQLFLGSATCAKLVRDKNIIHR